MMKMKSLTGFLVSLKTTIWLVALLIMFLFAGAFVMPGRKEFQLIHSQPLFEWLREQPFSATWWLWAAIFIIAVIVLNTIFCSVESVIRKRTANQWLLLISPQIVHIGFLFIVLAHLMSAFGSYKDLKVAERGTVFNISEDDTIMIKDIKTRMSSGYIHSWEVDVQYYRDGRMLHNDVIRPNEPSVRSGLNITVKDIRVFPTEAVLLQISREPGALWALIGGILFMAGIIIIIVLKINKERS